MLHSIPHWLIDSLLVVFVLAVPLRVLVRGLIQSDAVGLARECLLAEWQRLRAAGSETVAGGQ